MVSRPTLIAALVVAEILVAGLAMRSIGLSPGAPAPHVAVAPVQRTFATGSAPRVVVTVGNLPLTIRAAGPAGVRVVEELERSGWVIGEPAKVEADAHGDDVRVRAVGGAVSEIIGDYRHALMVSVPPDASVEVHASDSTVELDGLRGRVVAETRNGRIEGNDLALLDGALRTRSGRITASVDPRASDATVDVASLRGTIRVDPALPAVDGARRRRTMVLGSGRGRFTISTRSGRITLTPGASTS